jgi:dTDP-4-dehydrorhamnose 3,5-epimerase
VILRDAGLPGAFLVEQERHVDERGWFARTYCADEFARAGLDPTIAQCSVSRNTHQWTMRGLHLQNAPHEEAKLVRCTRGRIFDVLVDLRPDAPMTGTWVSYELDDESGRALYVPPGVAHGFMTLEPDCEVLYQISVMHEPSAASGIRWDDPDIGIEWPHVPSVLSERDAALPTAAELGVVTRPA